MTSTCGFCGGPIPCLTHSQFSEEVKMNAMRHRISGSDAAEDDDIPQCQRCGALVQDPCQTDEKAKTCELPDFCFPHQPSTAPEPPPTHGASYNQGLADADVLIGALWSDLFNKDLVKAAGADYFDTWRARIKELKASEPNVTARERQLFSALEQISMVCNDNGIQGANKDMALKFAGEVARKALAFSPPQSGDEA